MTATLTRRLALSAATALALSAFSGIDDICAIKRATKSDCRLGYGEERGVNYSELKNLSPTHHFSRVQSPCRAVNNAISVAVSLQFLHYLSKSS